LHEMAIMQNILEIINTQIKEYNLKKISNVKIVAGELTGVVPEIMEFCWQVCTENTPCAGAKLEIEKLPARALCRECSHEYDFLEKLSCPRCGGGIKKVLSGKELYVNFIEGE